MTPLPFCSMLRNPHCSGLPYALSWLILYHPVSFLPFLATSMGEKPPGLMAMEFLSGFRSHGITDPETSRLG